MSIRLTTGVILLGVFTLYILTDRCVQYLVIMPSFERLAREEAPRDMDRCVAVLADEIGHLSRLCHDWSAWDDKDDL